ncbi:hypothetical protein HZH68_002895 [Vespula germanica]|uniref:Uncharacterized protein n=1 Tax=Vespula germanica TaxID=30212 RepID=A0A834NNB1_VESGE|nr:hypothetical protein HZH68_002895 [Vespula germanica]
MVWHGRVTLTCAPERPAKSLQAYLRSGEPIALSHDNPACPRRDTPTRSPESPATLTQAAKSPATPSHANPGNIKPSPINPGHANPGPGEQGIADPRQPVLRRGLPRQPVSRRTEPLRATSTRAPGSPATPGNASAGPGEPGYAGPRQRKATRPRQPGPGKAQPHQHVVRMILLRMAAATWAQDFMATPGQANPVPESSVALGNVKEAGHAGPRPPGLHQNGPHQPAPRSAQLRLATPTLAPEIPPTPCHSQYSSANPDPEESASAGQRQPRIARPRQAVHRRDRPHRAKPTRAPESTSAPTTVTESHVSAIPLFRAPESLVAPGHGKPALESPAMLLRYPTSNRAALCPAPPGHANLCSGEADCAVPRPLGSQGNCPNHTGHWTDRPTQETQTWAPDSPPRGTTPTRTTKTLARRSTLTHVRESPAKPSVPEELGHVGTRQPGPQIALPRHAMPNRAPESSAATGQHEPRRALPRLTTPSQAHEIRSTATKGLESPATLGQSQPEPRRPR